MCKFTYLGYEGCEEPDRHYLIRREKCTAKAHLRHWCSPQEQEEMALAEGEHRVVLSCPMCADVPIIYDQPLLEISHSRRSVLPAPYYDATTGKYSRHPRHHAHNTSNSNSNEAPAPLVPKPLNMGRVHRVHFDRSASESAVNRRRAERSPDFKLPAATYKSAEQDNVLLPATSYQPSAADGKLPKTLPMPQPMTITPPSSREGSLSPPQNRMNGVIRTIPPGESNRRELDSLRERAKGVAKDGRPSTPSSDRTTDRSRSGSESSTSSFGNVLPPPPPPPRRTPARKPSVASSTGSSVVTYSPPSKSSSVSSRTAGRRPEHHRNASNASTISTTDSLADRVKDTALRSIGFGGDRTASPERGRRPHRRDRLGSSSERSDSPSVWRPTISPPQLQKDSLGMAANGAADFVQSFKQRLVPFAPTSSKAGKLATDEARPKTPHPSAQEEGVKPVLRLYPSKADDEKVAIAAFNKMYHEEQKALLAARQEMPAASVVANPAASAQDDAQALRNDEKEVVVVAADTISQMFAAGSATTNKALPAAPVGALRRIKTGQVKTVTVAPPRGPKRANTSDVVGTATPPVKVKTGPLFRFAGVGGAKEQEFEIVSGGPDGAGQAF